MTFWVDDNLFFEFSLSGNDETQCALLDTTSSAQVGDGKKSILDMNLVDIIKAEREIENAVIDISRAVLK